MAKFGRKGKGGMPAISTASLPDIVFMLLFFFMVSTVMREVDPLVTITYPSATELKKLEDKSLVAYIYVGDPISKKYGTEDRIQLNDKFAQVSEIKEFIEGRRESIKEDDRGRMTTSLKVDKDAKMGIVTDIKQELRQCQALKISYSAIPKATSEN
jgi:biopolymer transport protein ExbD